MFIYSLYIYNIKFIFFTEFVVEINFPTSFGDGILTPEIKKIVFQYGNDFRLKPRNTNVSMLETIIMVILFKAKILRSSLFQV